MSSFKEVNKNLYETLVDLNQSLWEHLQLFPAESAVCL